MGLDFCGPVYVHTYSEFTAKSATARRYNKKCEKNKVWIAVFVCLVTRAIYLDLDPDLTTQSFFETLRRFFANYDPKTIFCDSAPTFKHAKKVLASYAAQSDPKFGTIKFNFRCPMAAWKGGYYERYMAIIKHHLKRALSKGIFPKIAPLNSLRTCMQEISTVINSRPITYDKSNPNDPLPLCPLNFLQPLRKIQPIPFPDVDNIDDPNYNPLPPSDPSHLLNLWSKLCCASKHFWSQWKNDYLSLLRERYEKITPKKQRKPNIGDLVLVADQNQPQSNWTVGIISEVFKNYYNQPDKAKVRIVSALGKGRFIERSVHHLLPLETENESKERNCPSPNIEADGTIVHT